MERGSIVVITYKLSKARAFMGEDYDTIIQIVVPLDEIKDPNEALAFYEQEARTLEDALVQCLPGGTYDALLRAILRRKTSHFTVPFVHAA